MARIYAGILGPLALLTSLARGLLQARETESMLFCAWCSLVVFAAVGCVVGWIARWIVDESVSASIRAELAADHPPDDAQATPSPS